jgi:hypothetical protein
LDATRLGEIRYRLNKESKEFSCTRDCYIGKILALNGKKTRSCYEAEENFRADFIPNYSFMT